MAAVAKAAETHVGNDNFQKDVTEVQKMFQQKFENFHEGALHSLLCTYGPYCTHYASVHVYLSQIDTVASFQPW